MKLNAYRFGSRPPTVYCRCPGFKSGICHKGRRRRLSHTLYKFQKSKGLLLLGPKNSLELQVYENSLLNIVYILIYTVATFMSECWVLCTGWRYVHHGDGFGLIHPPPPHGPIPPPSYTVRTELADFAVYE